MAYVRTTTLETTGAPVGTVEDPPRRTSAPPPRSRTPRRRSGGGVIFLPPWTRAPFLPFRQPAVILAVLGAALILACASSSGVLFLSSASSESLRRLLAVECPDAGYPTVRATQVVGDPATAPPGSQRAGDATVRSAMTGAGLADPYRVRLGEQTTQVIRGAQATGGRIFFRDGVTSQITPVGRTLPGPGIWLQAGMATRLDAAVGSRVSFSVSGEGQGAGYRVVGIYRNQDQEPVRPYWCSYTNLFQNPSYGNDSVPPPLVIPTDAATFQASGTATSAPARTAGSRRPRPPTSR